MKERLLAWLACPVCRRATLTLHDAQGAGDEIDEGWLRCERCDQRYRIVRAIPRLLPLGLDAGTRATAERFAYEWSRYDEIRPEYEAQFRGWIAPFDPSEFAGRLVLDAGCGKGRHLRLAARFGARDVIGLDLGPSIDVSARNTRDLPSVHLVQGDLTRPPLRVGVIEAAYSIGVLHHLTDPRAGFRALATTLAPGAVLVAWVYAREGNEMLLPALEPLRRITRRLPLGAARALAWPPAALVTGIARALYGPPSRYPRLVRRLPYASYLVDLGRFPLREVHSIVFDQLLAPVAHYMSKSDVEAAVREAGLLMRSLTWHHRNSWTAVTVRDRGATGTR